MTTDVRRLSSRAALGMAILAAAPAIAAPLYAVVPAQSSLSFVGTQQGEKFTGAIRDFDARIEYAPSDLATSKLDVTIRMKSLDTKSPDRDQALATADWFDFAKFPTATFRTVAIRMTPTGPVGDADLTIKGRSKRVAFPFTWKVSTTGATLDAQVTLDRLDFGLGAGDWADESMVGRKVEVVVHLTLATPAAPLPQVKPADKPGKP
jgi:polyisoprenoid-binding protein YceI